jgi:uncharacterized membrane protein
MFSKIKSFKIKEWLIILMSVLFITDILIILNVPFLREFMAFICFTTVPGILILHIMRLNKMEFLKKSVLLVGLSISFLIFAGLLLNSLYPLLLKPLSLLPVLVSFNVILIILALVAYWRNRDDFKLGDFLNLKIESNAKLNSMLIFPVIFPFMAVLGTYLMNTTQNNIILLVMLFLIPIYIIAVAFLKDRIHRATYPFALWMIAMSLLLMHGLTSYYIMGRDVHSEFYCFQLTLSNLHWNIYDYSNPYNACLSITILPTVYKALSGMADQYIFKLIFGIIGSAIPLMVYIVSKKYIGSRYAFFAALLFVFQIFFINLLGAVRQEIAILFFFLVIMVIFDSKLNELSKKALFLIFMFSLVVSHYTTAYAAFAIIIPILLVPFLRGLVKDRKIVLKNFDIILITFVFIVIWYFLVAKVQYSAGAHVIATAMTATSSGSNYGRGNYVLGILGIVLKSVPNTISVIVHDLIFATIMVGILSLIWKYKECKNIFGTEFLVGIALSIILMITFVVLPYISIAYDVSRLFFQVLIFLAPVFIIGAITISRLIKKPKWDIVIILVLLISLFSCATYLQYHFYGTPYSSDYEKNGLVRGDSYIYTSELTGINWLKENEWDNQTIYSDNRELSRFKLAGFNDANINATFFQWNKTVSSGYIYLGYVNVNKKKVYEIFDDIRVQDMKNYHELFVGKERVYDDGGSQIWI